MKILALDSTAKAASVALLEDGKILASSFAENAKTHSELLLPMVEKLCKGLSVPLQDIDYYAVTVGPGSFTGVRIGVCVAKGLAFRFPRTGEKNCIAVSTLEALAQNLYGLDGIYVPVMDARRNEVYNALFRMEKGKLTRLCPDRAIPLSVLAEELMKKYPKEPIRLCGDGVAVARRFLENTPLLLPETPALCVLQSAASVALCAYRMAERGEIVSDEALSPSYLRVPQAERERLEREAAKNSQV
ncbi:MAG: tRNA (adenosine(37)-N6)-threonylcarbamoyltransferase complex dimerization subunit type 1 TsaB [Clostridia bacterium]|nr:tRNA (adenosine(37)-N6)-threonylcarbamoyltransferase complex dimerization subunit type 1 TsaB [Clostridia bacterium]